MAIISAFPGKAKPKLQSKTVTPAISEQIITPDSGYDGLSDVTAKKVRMVAINYYRGFVEQTEIKSTDGITLNVKIPKSLLNQGTIGGIEDIFLLHIKAINESKLTDTDVKEQLFTIFAIDKSAFGYGYRYSAIHTLAYNGSETPSISTSSNVAENTGFTETSSEYQIPIKINNSSFKYSTETNYCIQVIGRNMSK